MAGVGLDGPDGVQGLQGTGPVSLTTFVSWHLSPIPSLHGAVLGGSVSGLIKKLLSLAKLLR